MKDETLRELLTIKQYTYYKEQKAGSTTVEIASRHGLSQSVVSRSLKAAKIKILRYLEEVGADE